MRYIYPPNSFANPTIFLVFFVFFVDKEFRVI